MASAHPLRDPKIVTTIERAASSHLGQPWVNLGLADLNDRASHPCGILRGQQFSVFAKFSRALDARDQFTAELAVAGRTHGRRHYTRPVTHWPQPR